MSKEMPTEHGQSSSNSNVQYVHQAVPPPPPYSVNQPQHVPQLVHPAIVQQPGAFQTVLAPVSPDPMIMTCPSCGHSILTRAEYSPSCKTHLAACITFLVMFPCTFLPYCISACNNVDHYCPNCNTYIGGRKF